MQQDPKRLILFIVLSIGILVFWTWKFPPPKPTPRKNAAALAKAKAGKAGKPSKRTLAKGKKAAKRQPAQVKGAQPSSRPTSQAASSKPTSQASAKAAARPVARKAPPAPRVPIAKTQLLSYKGKKFVATVTSQGGALLHWKLAAFYDMKAVKKAKADAKAAKNGTKAATKKDAKAPKKDAKAPKKDAKAKKGTKVAKKMTRGALRKERMGKRPRMDLVSKLFPNKLPFTERLLDKRLIAHDLVPYTHTSKPKPNVLRFWGRIPSSKGGYVEVEKRYIFDAKRYRFKIELRLTNRTKHDVKSKMGMRLQDAEPPKNLEAGGMFSFQQEQLHMLCRRTTEDKPTRVDYLKLRGEVQKMMKKNPTKTPSAQIARKVLPGNVGYMALDRRYFVMAAVPTWGKGDRGMGCSFRANILGQISGEMSNVGVDISPGKSRTMSFVGYYGPKYYDTLKKASGKLETTVDFGYLAFLSKPMLWTMQFFYDTLKKIGIFNWGIAIILLTLLVKLLLWPMTAKSMQSMKKMQKLKPEMDKLKEKYGDDKDTIQRETMNLYVKHGINPISGCLPMLLQMPIWIALYQTILYSVELYQAPFIPGWIDDLSARDPIFVLPVMLGFSMVLQHRLTPQTMDGAQAKIMGFAMPIFFTVIMLFLPAGLTLYIFVNTVLGIAHQWHIYQQPDKDEPEGKDKKPTRKGWMQRMQQYVEEQQGAQKK